MDDYYRGAWRMDWGLGNPNTTATLIAGLMLATCALAYLDRHRGFWLAWPLFNGLGCCLIQTYSRGGMLALLAGGTVVLAGTRRPWRWSWIIGVSFAIGVMSAYAIQAHAQDRYEQGLLSHDESIASRLIIWKHFPEMLAAAPWGCGWGQAGDFYTQWFQPTDQSLNYLNLINSHLTWMVEGGWGVAALYIFGWLAIIATCWPRKEWRLGPLPLAAWVALFVGGCFSHVEKTLWIWITPLAFLGYAVWERYRHGQGLNLVKIFVAACFSIGAVVSLIALGLFTASAPITATRDAVILGRGTKVTIIYMDHAVMGQLYGHTLRRFLASNREAREERKYIITESPSIAIPPGAEVVIAGRMSGNTSIISGIDRSDHIILINPNCYPFAARWNASLAARSSLYWGEYADAPARSSWPDTPCLAARVIYGAAEFVPGWPQVIWRPSSS